MEYHAEQPKVVIGMTDDRPMFGHRYVVYISYMGQVFHSNWLVYSLYSNTYGPLEWLPSPHGTIMMDNLILPVTL